MQAILNLMRHSTGSQCNCLSKPRPNRVCWSPPGTPARRRPERQRMRTLKTGDIFWWYAKQNRVGVGKSWANECTGYGLRHVLGDGKATPRVCSWSRSRSKVTYVIRAHLCCHENRFSQANDWIATKLEHDAIRVDSIPSWKLGPRVRAHEFLSREATRSAVLPMHVVRPSVRLSVRLERWGIVVIQVRILGK